jgi:hypothetical protein
MAGFDMERLRQYLTRFLLLPQIKTYWQEGDKRFGLRSGTFVSGQTSTGRTEREFFDSLIDEGLVLFVWPKPQHRILV